MSSDICDALLLKFVQRGLRAMVEAKGYLIVDPINLGPLSAPKRDFKDPVEREKRVPRMVQPAALTLQRQRQQRLFVIRLWKIRKVKLFANSNPGLCVSAHLSRKVAAADSVN